MRKETITLWRDGQELREFLYIDDLERTVARLTFHDYAGIVNIVGGKSRSFSDTLGVCPSN